jgi:hypothetical protein
MKQQSLNKLMQYKAFFLSLHYRFSVMQLHQEELRLHFAQWERQYFSLFCKLAEF